MRARRWERAVSKGRLPPIAEAVRAATSAPTPWNAASSSIPSSSHTVLSTSKQTI